MNTGNLRRILIRYAQVISGHIVDPFYRVLNMDAVQQKAANIEFIALFCN